MNIQEIKALIEALQASDMTSFSYQKDGLKLKIEKKQNQVVQSSLISTSADKSVANNASTTVDQTETHPELVENLQVSEGEVLRGNWTVSPLVGVYYGSPSPTSPSFVKVGDYVKKGDVLCIIEAMKVMNEITAPCEGKVLAVAAANETLVEYGQNLILIG